MVAATKLLPRHLHVSAIGFAAAFGGSGAALFSLCSWCYCSGEGSESSAADCFGHVGRYLDVVDGVAEDTSEAGVRVASE